MYMALTRRTKLAKRSQTRRTKRSQTRRTKRSGGGMDNIGYSISDHLHSLFPEFDASSPFKITKIYESKTDNSNEEESSPIQLNLMYVRKKHYT